MPGAGDRGRVTMIASVQRYLTADVGEHPAATLAQLQKLLDEFTDYYNNAYIGLSAEPPRSRPVTLDPRQPRPAT